MMNGTKISGLILALCLWGMGTMHGQENWKSIDKRKYVFAKALVKYGKYEEDYKDALDAFMLLHPKDTSYDEIYFQIGLAHFMLDARSEEAAQWLEKAHGRGIGEAQFYLGRIAHYDHHFNTAIKHYANYKLQEVKQLENKEVDYYIGISKRAIKALSSPVNVKITNMGPEVNSPYKDYVPLVTADGKKLIFTSRRPGTMGGLKDPNGEFYEDIYESHISKGKWTKATNMGKPLNTESHDASVGISPNANTLLIYRTNENLTGGDLYITQLASVDNWMPPTKLGPTINSEYQEASACLSVDGNLMYFSSNRPGGYGGKDLYVARRLPHGKWGQAVNMGPNINSEYDEDAPFLDPGGKVLYFSSNGHSTIGGYDIFRTRLNEEKQWGIAENLGYPLNTVEDDLYFTLTADGKAAYYSSVKPDGMGDHDIYKIELLFDHPRPSLVKGPIKDDFGNPIKAKVTVSSVAGKSVQGIYRSNASTGKYLLILEPETKYKLVVEAKGFENLTEFVEYELAPANEEHQLELTMKKKGVEN